MTQAASIIERAFQLAEQCARIEEIRAKLKQEGYSNVDAHLAGGRIKSDLNKILSRKVSR